MQNRLEASETKMKDMLVERDTHEREISDLKQTLRAQAAREQEQMHKLEREIPQLQSQGPEKDNTPINRLGKELITLQNRFQFSDQNLKEALAARETYEIEIDTLQRRLKEQSSEALGSKKNLENEIAQLKKKVSAVDSADKVRYEEPKSTANSDIRQEAESLQARLKDSEKKLRQTLTERDTFEIQLKQAIPSQQKDRPENLQWQKLLDENMGLRTKAEELHGLAQERFDELQEAEEEIEILRREVEKLQDIQDDQSLELSQLEGKYDGLQQKWSQFESQHRLAQQQKSATDGRKSPGIQISDKPRDEQQVSLEKRSVQAREHSLQRQLGEAILEKEKALHKLQLSKENVRKAGAKPSELEGDMKETYGKIQFLKAKIAREKSFRSGLLFTKNFMSMQIKSHEAW